jgi:hypothetical protein
MATGHCLPIGARLENILPAMEHPASVLVTNSRANFRVDTRGLGSMPKGIYRVRDPKEGRINLVCVRYDAGADLEIEEAHYVAQGYQPLVDQLPWKESYKEKASARPNRK